MGILKAQINDDEVQAIIERVRLKVGGGEAPPPAVHTDRPSLGDGIHATVDEAVQAASKAFEAYRSMGLEGRRLLVEAVRSAMRTRARELAHMAHTETGLGRAEDKVLKNLLVIEKTPGPEDLEPQVWSGDQGLTITEYAPFGVIGAIT
ncbi:MAG: aldehyde dehydrogenase family protein, partial [Acidobacteriota bacterium]